MDGNEHRTQYKQLLEETRKEYSTIRRIYCSCLGTYVMFNAQGLHHLKYHGGGEARTVKDKIHKLKLFPLVIPVLKHASAINEYKQTIESKNRKSNTLQKQITY